MRLTYRLVVIHSHRRRLGLLLRYRLISSLRLVRFRRRRRRFLFLLFRIRLCWRRLCCRRRNRHFRHRGSLVASLRVLVRRHRSHGGYSDRRLRVAAAKDRRLRVVAVLPKVAVARYNCARRARRALLLVVARWLGRCRRLLLGLRRWKRGYVVAAARYGRAQKRIELRRATSDNLKSARPKLSGRGRGSRGGRGV